MKTQQVFSGYCDKDNVPGLSLLQARIGLPRFGELPPDLFTYQKPREFLGHLRQGKAWVNPDGEFTDEELDVIKSKPGGVLYLYRENGFRKSLREAGGLRKLLKEMKLTRLFKEEVKRRLNDENQDYTPISVNGVWMHRHDKDHLDVAKLPPIEMGDYKNVTGVDGINAELVPHFHPGNQNHEGRYPGMLDEYRVAIHQHLRNPTAVSRVRLEFYKWKMKNEVPDADKAIEAHRKVMDVRPNFLKRFWKKLVFTVRMLVNFVKSFWRGGKRTNYKTQTDS